MKSRLRRSRLRLIPLLLIGMVAAMVALAPHRASASISGDFLAAVDTSIDGSGHCLSNGLSNGGRCNFFDAKSSVWMYGGAQTNAFGPDGQYLFVVMAPGGQSDPNDGGADVLSTDAYTNRIFTVTNGAVSDYIGTHTYDHAGSTPYINAGPFDDTPNGGGVYVLAACYLGAKNGPITYPVAQGSCRYDTFKIQGPSTLPEDLVVVKDANPTFTRTYAWGISKGVDKTQAVQQQGSTATFNYAVNVTHDAGTDSAWQVDGTISVFNPNTFDISGVQVADTISANNTNDANATCTVVGGASATVSAGSSADLPYTCTYAGTPASYNETNTATATWDGATYGTPDSAASFSIPFTFGAGPIPANPTLVDDCVNVTDTVEGALGTVCQSDTSPTPFTYARQITVPAGCQSYGNTATYTADTTGTTGLDSKSVTVCGPLDLWVSATANPAFKRSYSWQIAKSVDKTLVEQLGGGTATFNYGVTATKSSPVDSNWTVTGTITVNNPNTVAGSGIGDVSGVTVTAAVSDPNAACVVTGGTNVTVAAGDSAPLAYTCTYSSAPNPASDSVTATATWNQAQYYTPDGTASGSAAFNFGTASPTLIDACATVTDTFDGTPVQLGTPCATATYTYAHTVSVPSSNCLWHTNTAAFTTNTTGTTGSSNKVVVEVCGPARTGALTMGFWQNKNGQGIIAGQAKTGVCPSATWLRQYAPFQDLSATATCGAVGSTSNSNVVGYVYNIIKAANAGGATMNAMLKAQMLATALDVYFSDPALGGNKIGAFNGLGSSQQPIGGVSIDLTKICRVTDLSTGSGTCSGMFENVSGAFGSATSLTVSQMLTYAAGQSNVGGSTWYVNVKATQGLAKDAFDAINNGVAFAP